MGGGAIGLGCCFVNGNHNIRLQSLSDISFHFRPRAVACNTKYPSLLQHSPFPATLSLLQATLSHLFTCPPLPRPSLTLPLPRPFFTPPSLAGVINREATPAHVFTVCAVLVVGGGEEQRATTTYTILVEDRNDNTPTFLDTVHFDLTIAEDLEVSG